MGKCKFFVCSDIHSAYTPWIDALNDAGYDENNGSHKIVVCGDLFDRMHESQKVYEFAKDMIEKHKLIYIRGNHELLIKELCERGYSKQYDWSNGTMHTVIDLATDALSTEKMFTTAYQKLKPLLDKTINYLELKQHILVHSWIPLINRSGMPAYYKKHLQYEFNPDWRNASDDDWKDATWNNPFELAERGFLPDKKIIFGHYHTSYARHRYEGKPEFGEDADFSPYYGDWYIGIDSCVAHSGKINCLAIEDEFMEDDKF